MTAAPVEKFEEILKILWSHLVAANTHLTIWEELRSTPERNKLCNTYAGFFSWTRDAHIDRFIHKICVTTDMDNSQPSIPKLANMIQAHPELAAGLDFKTVFQRIKDYASIRDDIRKVRDKRSSHWDMNQSPPEPNVAECHDLIDELRSILDDIWNAHTPGKGTYSLVPIGHDDTKYVLDKLTK